MKVLVSGSFDPPTLGHLDIIKRAAAAFEEVRVCIFANSAKSCAFSVDERKKMLILMCEGIPNVTVDSSNETVPAYCQKNGITVLVKGVRNAKDLEYENDLFELYRSQNKTLDTVYFPCDAKYRWVSSTAAREVIKYTGDLSELLHEKVIKML
jgi:pantetheine-phosphate adenylyltransferase